MSNEEMIRIGMRLRDVRMQRGITQKELGAKTGLSPCHISDIERGKTIGLDSVVALSAALDVSLDYIVRGIRPQMGAWGLVFRSDEELDSALTQMQ